MKQAIGFFYLGAAYCDEAKALINRMSLPTMKFKNLVNTSIVSLIDAGIWSKADVIRFMKTDSQVNALLNWVKNANNAIAVNSPIFTPYSGFRSASAAGGYINANYNLYSEAVHSSVYNVSAAWGITDYNIAANDVYFAGAYPAGSPYFLFRPYRTNTTVTVYVNSSAGASSLSNPVVNGLHHMKRTTNSNQYYKRNDGAFLSGTNAAASAPPNLSIFELSTNLNNTPTSRVLYEEDFAFYGAALNDSEAAALYTIYSDFNSKVAATA